jgi:diketogulonate reductase-like aldo/keto reductase
MGYNDSLQQFDFLLQQMQTPYCDLLLNHWPTSPASPTVDPLCDPKKPTYDEKGCRLSTWRAYVDIWKSGKSLAIGVANYSALPLSFFNHFTRPMRFTPGAPHSAPPPLSSFFDGNRHYAPAGDH